MTALRTILVLNPNTSSVVTDRFVKACVPHVPEGVVLEGVTGSFGAAVVSTRAENVIAGYSALDLLATHVGGCDAVILAISFDTALSALRDISPAPVVAATASALVEARAAVDVGSILGLVTFGAMSRPLYEDLIRRYGMNETVIIDVVEIEGAAGYLDESLEPAILDSVERLLTAGAKSIVVCGAAIAGIAEALSDRTGVPIFDSAGPSVRAALRRIVDPVKAPRHPRTLGSCTGVSPALAALIRGDAP